MSVKSARAGAVARSSTAAADAAHGARDRSHIMRISLGGIRVGVTLDDDPRVPASRLATDHVDRVVGDGDDVEVTVRPLLDGGRGTEALADLERLALRPVELRRP